MIKITRRLLSSLIIGAAVMACGATGANAITKTATDAAGGVKCLTDNWGKTPEQVAEVCFANEVALALDAIADAELLLQKNGSPPTKAYLADARVTQRVLARQAAAKAGQ